MVRSELATVYRRDFLLPSKGVKNKICDCWLAREHFSGRQLRNEIWLASRIACLEVLRKYARGG
jgi:hypothetical protein